MKILIALFFLINISSFSQEKESQISNVFPNLELEELTDLEFASFFKAKKNGKRIVINSKKKL